jgi:hypothetical protein
MLNFVMTVADIGIQSTLRFDCIKARAFSFSFVAYSLRGPPVLVNQAVPPALDQVVHLIGICSRVCLDSS